MTGIFKIENRDAGVVQIDIEGVIGVSEVAQFDEPQGRIATYGEFKKKVEQIRNIRAPRVEVNIRSTGGEVNDALLIHDALVGLDAEVTTRCFGYVASAATIIAQAASIGRREISSNALYLIHNSVSCGEGNARMLGETVALLKQTDRRIAELYARRSGRKVDVFEKLMGENGGNGRWLSPKEVLDAGLADRIVAAEPLKNDAMKMIAELGLPKPPYKMFNQNQISQGMNISKKWSALLDVLGWQAGKEKSLGEREMQRIDEELAQRGRVIDRMAQEKEKNDGEHRLEVERLQNRIAQLEALNARLKAGASCVKPREDPSVHEYRRAANDDAYELDAKGFK